MLSERSCVLKAPRGLGVDEGAASYSAEVILKKTKGSFTLLVKAVYGHEYI